MKWPAAWTGDRRRGGRFTLGRGGRKPAPGPKFEEARVGWDSLVMMGVLAVFVFLVFRRGGG
jgi:hypothetical protein